MTFEPWNAEHDGVAVEFGNVERQRFLVRADFDFRCDVVSDRAAGASFAVSHGIFNGE